jgi:leader peptidase (prepilin peptidase)/N-methyltransferase
MIEAAYAPLLASKAAASAAAFAFGLLIGSFLNVVILRLPDRLLWGWRKEARELLELDPPYEPAPPDLVVQGSRCPRCGHALAPWENIPVLSFVLLRGRCRGCKAPISWQYPLVELLTGLLFAACVWRFGVDWTAVSAIVFSAFLIAGFGIDLRTTLLPDGLTLPLLWLGLLQSLVTLFVPAQSAILGAALGYLSLWSLYWVFKWLTGKEGMGYGDFKLLAALGAWCGPQGILPILLMSSAVAAVLGTLILKLRGGSRDTPMPYGPYLAVAGWIQFFWGREILEAYLRWAAPGAP